MPAECRQYVEPVSAIQEIKIGMMFGVVILIASYLQQVDVSLIYIKRWIMGRQQEQLNSYFQSQEDAVVLFTSKNKDDESQSKIVSSSPLQNNSTLIAIQVHNPALRKITGIQILEDPGLENQDFTAPNSQLEEPIFQVSSRILQFNADMSC